LRARPKFRTIPSHEFRKSIESGEGRVVKRGCLPAAGLGAVSLLALMIALVAALNAIGCCAIDCEKYPEKCAENQRRQQNASLVLVGALVVCGASLGGAVYVLRRK
jgi:hypothetical protein